MTEYKSTSHVKYLCQYHIIFCPKFRFKVLNKEVKGEFLTILKEISERYSYEVLETEVMPDHVHLFLGCKPTVAPMDMVRTIKSITAVQLFKRIPKLKQFYSRCGSLWFRGSFVSTIGKVSEATIRRYIKEQNNGHSSSR
jgi:putative transposase